MAHESIVAIIGTRNEELYIEHSIRGFVSDGIEVILIDNDSSDNTRRIAESFLGKGLLSIHHLPWDGFFSLDAQLALKTEIIADVRHDWIIHADSDEWLQPPPGYETLYDAIQDVSSSGANAINFNEFVFVPQQDDNFENTDFRKAMLAYYFFEPNRPRLVRAWRREIDASNAGSGGHLLEASGRLKIFSEDFILRHYIALSYDHSVSKYVGRRFNEDEMKRGWHFNRVNISNADLILRPSGYLKTLHRWDDRRFDLSNPAPKHYWQW